MTTHVTDNLPTPDSATTLAPQISRDGGVWWGTYPEAGLGTPTGVGEGLWFQTSTSAHSAVELPAPSFLVTHPSSPLIYAVSETDPTEVHVINVGDSAQPRVVATVVTGGHSGCHLLLAPDARTLYVSHFISGDLAVIQLGEDGLPVTAEPAQVFGHEGSGPGLMQESPRAHFAGFAPGGHHVLVCDLGTDELRRYALRSDGLLDDHGIAATLPPGSGPRHFTVRGEHLYVLCQLDNQVRTLRWDHGSGSADLIAELPATTAPYRAGDGMHSAHIALVGEGVLLASVRGANVIAVFDLAPEGEARYRGSFDAGHWPRYFAVIGDRLHVGAETGHEVRTYALADVLALPPEPEVGHIAHLPHASAALPSPACVVAHPA